MTDQIKQLKENAEKEISQTKDMSCLDKIWRKYLGRQNGQLTKVLRGIKNLPISEKPKIGTLANQVKVEIEKSINQRKRQLQTINNQQSRFIGGQASISNQLDFTLPGKKTEFGHLHALTQARYKVAEIFSSMGFEILQGPELETDYYNFEALNIPEGHPARDMFDTFYIKSAKGDKLLRTHTSPMQVRVMEKRMPPLRVIIPGRCFRHEATDASHDHTFYQVEGFVVDKEISVANLIYTLKSFLNALFKREVKVRLRPGYFPFVEPGFELDFRCVFCEGKGCSVCKQTGWLELIPCGMVHPKVFEYVGYPKDVYTGFAFGAGLDRIVMMKHRIDDIRLLHSGDLRFIRQF